MSTPAENRSLLIEPRGDVDWVTLNRPERLNTLTEEMASALLDYFHGQLRHPTCRVIVLQGSGQHFCAGFDIANVNQILSSNSAMLRTQKSYSEIVLCMRRCPQPIIALLQGAATGGGLALALAADVRYATADVRMNVAMAKVGLTGCDMGISYFLPRIIGVSRAAELMMTGRFCTAAKAVEIGLVADVVPDLRAAGEALSGDMLKLSPLGLRLTKEGLNMALGATSLEAALVTEDRAQALAMGSGMAEGMKAFLEKRPPKYTDD